MSPVMGRSTPRIAPKIKLPKGGSSRHKRCYRAKTAEGGPGVTPASIRDYLATIRSRYTVASRALKHQILDELCATSGYTRKGAIRALNHQPVSPLEDRRGRPSLYTSPVRIALGALWEAAGYPWSHRLKAMLPLWLPWAAQRFTLSPDTLRQLQAMS